MDSLKIITLGVDSLMQESVNVVNPLRENHIDWWNFSADILSGLFITIVGGVVVWLLTNKACINFKTITSSVKTKKHVSKYAKGSFIFDYSNNNGSYIIGDGVYQFTTKWSKASNTSIHAYSDARDIKAIGLMKGVTNISDIKTINADFSSRVRTPRIGDVVIWENINGYYAATRVIRIQDDTRGDSEDLLECQYVIYK